MTLVVLATSPPPVFAVFSFCLTTYLLVLQCTRHVIGTPVLVTQAGPGDHRSAAEAAAGAALVGGLVLVPALAGLGAAWPAARALLWVLALTAAALMVQDVLRHVAIAWGRPAVATAADGLWLVVQIGASAVVLAFGGGSATVLLGVWAVGGMLSAVFLSAVLGLRPAVRRARAWLAANATLCRRTGLEFLANSGSYFILSYGLVIVAGAAELGYLRAAQSLFGPASVLLMGGSSFGVPESVRMRGDAPGLRRFGRRLSTLLAVVAGSCGAVLFVALPGLGPRLMPQLWEPVREVIPVLALFGAAIGVAAGPIAVLRGIGRSGWVLRGRQVAGATALAIGLPLSAALGAAGMLGALAVAEGVLAAWAWATMLRATAPPVSSPPATAWPGPAAPIPAGAGLDGRDAMPSRSMLA